MATTRSFASFAPPWFLLFVQNGTLMAQPFNVRSRSLTGNPITIADRVAFNPSTARAVFSVSQTGLLTYRMVGDTRLEWFDRAGESLGAVGSPGGYLQFSISPDSTRIAAARLDPIRGTSDIWLLDTRDNAEQRLTFDASWDILPLWSPDGSSVIFSSNRRGPWEVYRRSATGAGNDEQVVPSETSVFADDWSQDGRLLLRQWDRSEKGRFALVDIGRDPRLSTLPYRETENDGRISPDGRWVAYASYDAGMSIFVRPVASADTRWQISGRGASEVRWRADGRELFYLAPDLSIMSVAAESGKIFRALPPLRLFQTRAVQPSGVAGRAYDVTSDGQRFLINVPASSPPITAVVNWTALLER